MKKAFAVMLMASSFAAIVNLTPSMAQEVVMNAADVVAEATAFDEDKFAFGKVVAVAEGMITVNEYDFTKDADVDVAYVTTTETEYGNVSSAADLAVGDDIVIDYQEKDGKRVISTLVREEKDLEIQGGDEAAEEIPVVQ